jgi:outer membrane protein OmpA-like peptidoglycan-associated protein
MSVVALTAGLFAVLTAPAAAQSIEQEIEQVLTDLEQARGEEIHLIAPTRFEKAEKALAEAQKRFAKGDKIDKIEKNLDEARTALAQAADLEELGRVVMRDALEARRDALASNAPEFAAEEWTKAEKEMYGLGKRVEKGDGEKARGDANKTAGLYRDAELMAIRVDLLGRVKKLREEAVAARAEKWASVTLGRGDALLAEAENVLATDRYRQADARELAEDAGKAFRHATWIAKAVAAVDEDRTALEPMILEHEKQLVAVVDALGLESRFYEGFGAVAEDMLAGVRSLQVDRADLQQKVTELRAEAAELAKFKEAVEPLKVAQAKVETVRGMFTPDEADVVMANGRLVVHLSGLSFPSGSDQIQPKDFALLTKVQRTLREFPDTDAVIEGHTDSTGDKNYNLSLSQRRAEAVRQYLLANMARGEETLTAHGYGASRPVADNNTVEGRAKNRRIDIVIPLDAAM